MCFFPRLNLSVKPALDAGVTHFECGHCPECLSKRARAWALRAVYEARSCAEGCMITLTYDNYARDSRGVICGELPPDRSLQVSKRDVQLFLKRLRKYVESTTGRRIKYLLAAEYGSHTHRAHYHAIIFGYCFPDVYSYKRSKRGNLIYKSNILNKLWNHGICTVDSIRINAATARYCTKYTAKDRSDDTFMLFSHDIGLNGLLADFNGKSYCVEGAEYPIPRQVWQKIITKRYPNAEFDYRYQNRFIVNSRFSRSDEVLNPLYEENVYLRKAYRVFRDSNILYQGYRSYWKRKSLIRQLHLLPIPDRIRALPDSKYARYKHEALRVYGLRARSVPVPPPRVDMTAEYARYLYSIRTPIRRIDPNVTLAWRSAVEASFGHLPPLSCLIRANDTKLSDLLHFNLKKSLKSLDKGCQMCYNADYEEDFKDC